MPSVLHLVKGGNPALVVTSIARQLADGDQVTVALLHGAPSPAVPPTVRIRRIPEEASYETLLELIFQSDQVITW